MEKDKSPLICAFLSVSFYLIYQTFSTLAGINSDYNLDFYTILTMVIAGLNNIVFANQMYGFLFYTLPFIIINGLIWLLFINYNLQLKNTTERIKTAFYIATFTILTSIIAYIYTTNSTANFSSASNNYSSYPIYLFISTSFGKFIFYFAVCYIVLILVEKSNDLTSKSNKLNLLRDRIQNSKTLRLVTKGFILSFSTLIILLVITLTILRIQLYITKVGNLNIARENHSSIELNDGRVLIVGGKNEEENRPDYQHEKGYIVEAEIFNPHNNKFKIIGKLNESRRRPPLIKLRDGKIMIIGGEHPGGDIYRDTVEIFDPIKNVFIPAGHLSFKLEYPKAAINKYGQIAVVGYDYRLRKKSINGDWGKEIPFVIDVYNSKKMTFERKAVSNKYNSGYRNYYNFDIEALPDGKFLITGSLSDTQGEVAIFNPQSNKIDFKSMSGISTYADIIDVRKNGEFLIADSTKLLRFKYDGQNINLEKDYNLEAESSSFIKRPGIQNVFYKKGRIIIYNDKISEFNLNHEMSPIQKNYLNYRHPDGNVLMLNNGNLLITGGSKGLFKSSSDHAELFKVEK